MTSRSLRRGAAGLAAVGLGVAAFLLMLVLLQGTHQAQALTAQSVKTQTVAADLSITKTNGLTEVVPGMTVFYTITARNNSTGTITNALLTDFVPAQYEPKSFTVSGSNVLDVGVLTFTVGQPIYITITLAAGGSLNLVLSGTVLANATGILTNTAHITGDADISETNPINNIAIDADPIRVITTTPPTPEGQLQISKTDGVTQVVTGQNITYTVTVTNPTPFTLTHVRITDTLPVGFVISDAQIYFSNGITPQIGITANNTLITAMVSLNPQDRISITLAGTVGIAPSRWLTNTAAVSASPELTRVLGQVATDIDVITNFVELTRTTYLPAIIQIE